MVTNDPFALVLKDINNIKNSYCDTVTSKEQLKEWIIDCIQITIKDKKQEYEALIYLNCHIKYFKNLMLFSLIKTKVDSDGYTTGVSNEVGINMEPYFYKHFGTDRLNILKKTIQIIRLEMEDIANDITYDIDKWCKNIEDVFIQLNLKI